MWNSPLHGLSKSGVANGNLTQWLESLHRQACVSSENLKDILFNLVGQKFHQYLSRWTLSIWRPKSFLYFEKCYVLSPCSFHPSEIPVGGYGAYTAKIFSQPPPRLSHLFWHHISMFWKTSFFPFIFQITNSVLGCFYSSDFGGMSKLTLVIVFLRFWFSDHSFQCKDIKSSSVSPCLRFCF